MMKKNKTLWIVSFLPLAISAVLFFFLPERIPMHYDVAGNIDRWGSRREIFIFPVIIPLISLFWQCMIRSFEKTAASAKEEKARAEAQSNIKVLRLTAILMAIGFGLMHLFFTLSGCLEAISGAQTSMLDQLAIINIVWSVILILVGNFLPKAKRNSMVGLRTPKTLTDDEAWRKGNRFAGKALIIAAVITILESLLLGGILSTVLMVVNLITAAIVSAAAAQK